MRNAICAFAAAIILAAASAFSQSVDAQEAQRVRPDLRSQALRADVERVQIVPAGCQSVTITGFAPASVDLFDMSLSRVGAATREQLSSVRTALLCNSEPGHARIETTEGLRLVLRSALRLPQASIRSDRGIVRDQAGAAKQVRPPSAAAPSRESAVRNTPPPSIAAPNGPSAGPSLPDETSTMSVETRTLTPVLVELLSDQQRAPRNNGSAVAVLADPTSQVGAGKNLLLCQGLFVSFDQATTREVAVGARVGAEGELELLRPIYWLTRTASQGQPGAEQCARRLENFDYPRSYRIARKLGLAGAGPYLVVERHDLFETERVAAVIDLSRTPPGEIIHAVRYFRDGFMQAGDVWAPQRFQRTRARNDLIAFLGDDNANYNFVPRLVRAARQVGCPLTNLLDVCDN